MSEKVEEQSPEKTSPKVQSTTAPDKEEKKKEGEHTIEEIDRELDALRPPPPSPETKRRMEQEEREKDHETDEQQAHKTSSLPAKVEGGHEKEQGHHKESELTPGQPDPTVNDNVKIPVLNDHGDVELKPQQGSTLNKHHDNAQSANNADSSAQKEAPKE